MLRLQPQGRSRLAGLVATAHRGASSSSGDRRDDRPSPPPHADAQPPPDRQPGVGADEAAQPAPLYAARRLASTAAFFTKGAAAVAGSLARAAGVRPPLPAHPPARADGATPPAGAMQTRHDEPAAGRYARLAEEVAAMDAALGELPDVEDRFPSAGEAAAATTGIESHGGQQPEATRKLATEGKVGPKPGGGDGGGGG